MPSSPSNSRQSPRSDLHLQGRRPPPLRLNNESRRIRKQETAAKAKSHHHPPPSPVIIYTVSPEPIHVHKNEFMSVVQRLTGSNSSSSSSSTVNASPPAYAFQENGSGIFPAAQLGSSENAELPPEWRETAQVFDCGAVEIQPTSTWQFHGIPAMPQNLFRHASDSNPFSYLPHLNNTGLHGNMNLNNNLENNLISSQMPSPSVLDLFNSFSHI
ncbi:hypothetical protein C2S51_004155 [Perilla frutescens var. frutescens]|nr:hypothetical protein C2S51_004155 [Perilla frutescens var. frutescens]